MGVFTSDCAKTVYSAVVAAFPADDIKVAEDYVKYVSQIPRGLQSQQRTADVIMTSVLDTFLQFNRNAVEKGLVDNWTTKTGMTAAAKPGTKGTAREAQNQSLMHQHRRLIGEVSILSQTRAFYKNQIGNGAFGAPEVAQLVNRLNAFDGTLRLGGIPLVTMKPGGEHVSFLTTGDIFKTMIAGSAGKLDTVINGFLRTADAEKNIPLQNLQEAVRRIIETNDSRIPLQGEDLAKLEGDVLDALVNAMGKPVDADSAAALERTKKWMNSDEGRSIVAEVRDALVELAPKFIKEDLRQKQIALVLQRGDGISMANDALDALVKVPWTGDKIEGIGKLMLEDGLRAIYGDDFMFRLSPDGVNLAFGQQHLAKVFAELAPDNIAYVKEVFPNIKASRKDSAVSKKTGKTTHTAKNKSRKQKNDEIAEASARISEDAVQNDPNIRVSEPSVEAAKLANTFYNEFKYGSVVGGLAKALSFVSDRATMTSKGKTILQGTEHVSLESATTVVAGLRKLNDALGQDAKKANDLFVIIKDNLRKNENSIQDVLALVEPADRAAALTMIDYIDALFGAGMNNKLMQNAIFTEDLAKALGSVGLSDAAAQFKGVVHADDVLDYWRNFEVVDGENILDFMGRFYTAQQISMIPPTMADSLARHFSHVAEGLDYKQALKEGWFALDEKSPLGKYLAYDDKTKLLFPPGFQSKIKSVEDYLDFDRSLPAGTMGEAIRKVDQITSVLKSSITLWRPGHHMVSMLGNVFMNVLAKVTPYDYAMGAKLLGRRKKIFDINDENLNELMRLQAPQGTQIKDEMLDSIKIPIIKDGKTVYQTIDLDTINLAAERLAVYINPRRVRDVVTTDDLGSGAFSASRLLTKNPVAKGIERVDHELATFAAVRDNIARLPLFVKELRKMSPKRSLEEAFTEAAARVHEFHPTVGTLTGPERKIARRLFYFYTWQKQAFFKILEVTANQPALITVPSKLQFAIATSQGLDPNSFGDPFAAHGWFAGYNSASLYGPQWDDPKYGMMGVRPPIPQLDVIDSYLSGITFNPDAGLWENVGSLASGAFQKILVAQASPAFRIPAEVAINRTVTTEQQINTGLGLREYGEYAIDQTGFGSLSRVFDWTPWGPRSDTRLDPYSDFNRQRQWENWWTGLKKTAYESPAALRVARQEAIEYYRKKYQIGKFAPQPSLADVQEGTNE